MAANPLSYVEIEAFERKSLHRFNAWETELIMRLDDAVLAAIAPPEPDKPAVADVDISDRKGVRGLLAGIRDRMAAKR